MLGVIDRLIDGQDKIEVKKLLTKKFFDEKPEEVWRWHHQFRKLVINSAPNDAHYTLADMHNQCREIGITFTLITQVNDKLFCHCYYNYLMMIRISIVSTLTHTLDQNLKARKITSRKQREAAWS